jgi:subtilisin family serine protease
MRTKRTGCLGLPLIMLAWLGASVAPAFAEEFEPGEVIVRLNLGASIGEFNARWGTTTLDAYVEGNLYLLFAQSEDGVEDLADQMEQDPDVAWAEANYIQDTPEGLRQMVVNAVGGEFVDYEDQEISTRIGLPEAHALTRGAGVRIAVLDTGVDPEHEALVGHLAPEGFDFVGSDSEPTEEANGLDDDGDGMTDEGYAHGTMVDIVALVGRRPRSCRCGF